MRRWLGTRSNRDSALTPVLLLLVIVALPTAAVLWLMVEATQNERLAVRQRLADAYHVQLALVRDRAVSDWQARLAKLDALADGLPPAEAFATCARDGAAADSVIVLDAESRPAYPAPTTYAEAQPVGRDAAWPTAESLERNLDYVAAAAAYGQIAGSTRNDHEFAPAIQSQARSLLLSGQREAAAVLLESHCDDPRLQSYVAPHGRFLYADLMLLLVQLTSDSNRVLSEKTAAALASRLNDYARPLPSSAQRRFLMRELARLFPDSVRFPTATSEDLAGDYLDRSPQDPLPTSLQATGAVDVWKVASPAGRVLALFRGETIRAFCAANSTRNRPSPACGWGRATRARPATSSCRWPSVQPCRSGGSRCRWPATIRLTSRPVAAANCTFGRP